MGMMQSQEVSVFDDGGDLKPVVREIIGQAKEAGACISTGHLGQVGNPLPVDGYKQILGKLLDSGIPEKAIRLMISDNPSRLIGLD
jgi:hypothetical protein